MEQSTVAPARERPSPRRNLIFDFGVSNHRRLRNVRRSSSSVWIDASFLAGSCLIHSRKDGDKGGHQFGRQLPVTTRQDHRVGLRENLRHPNANGVVISALRISSSEMIRNTLREIVEHPAENSEILPDLVEGEGMSKLVKDWVKRIGADFVGRQDEAVGRGVVDSSRSGPWPVLLPHLSLLLVR